MKLATFNVNSLKIRLPIVLDWLAAHAPDVLMLQELKSMDVPVAEMEAAGYHMHVVPQKAYNGVATLTKQPATVIATSLLPDDEAARYLEVDYQGVRIINIYAPNGNPVTSADTPSPLRGPASISEHQIIHQDGGENDLSVTSPLSQPLPLKGRGVVGEKFAYKLKWLTALYDHLKDLRANQIDFVVAGDFNVIPEEIDAANPKDWVNDALFQSQSRALYRAMLHLGLTDAVRAQHPEPGIYTFWDYQAGAWPRNNGIRIDHFLLSPKLADKLSTAEVDKAPRALEKPSDHTPVWVQIGL